MLFSVSDLELMREIRVGGGGGGGGMRLIVMGERGGNSAVALGGFVAMEISGEAIRNVQIVFEWSMHN